MRRLAIGWTNASLVLLATLAASPLSAAEDEFERPPVSYSESTPDNAVSRLQSALDRGDVSLRRDEKFGYLPDLLDKLSVPADSQTLVFSKTSLQRARITPRTPRALYFSDETYVGYCHQGDVLEISTADPRLGTVFYTLDQTRDDAAVVTRETHQCLLCHGASQTDYVPGHTLRSLFVDAGGLPLLAEGSHRVDPSTPIEDRWGGWYVTGTHGEQRHLGNLVIRDKKASKPWIDERGQNLVDLSERFKTSLYLTPHSDLVALLVLEHQTHVHNLITQASFTARQALHYEAAMNKALGEPVDKRLESTTRRIDAAAEKLVRGMLCVDEAPLRGPYAGTSGFAENFPRRGPRDSKGRSLRDLDLRTRTFKHSCSYLIHSAAFDALPGPMKEVVARKLRDALEGRGGEAYSRLAEDDRRAILEILAETKPDLWNAESK